MYKLKVIVACTISCIVSLFGESEPIVINKLDLIGNENISLI